MRLLQIPLLLLFFAAGCSTEPESTALFPIVRDGRWGFINIEGKEVIKPVFRSVGRFTDSLAPARLNGTWGFINRQGAFVIEPIYDYATEFSNGLARVWRGSKPGFIDLNGRNRFELPDSTCHIEDFEKGLAEILYVKNDMLQKALLMQDGSLEPYNKMEYSEGLWIVERTSPDNNDTQYAVKDIHGNFIVPFDKYNAIEPFHEGLAVVEIYSDSTSEFQYGFIRQDGSLAFLLPVGSSVDDNYFSEGLIAINTKLPFDKNRHASWDDYIIWYDTAGNQVSTMKEINGAMPLVHGKAIFNIAQNHGLMNRNGQRIGKNWFWSFEDYDFSDNLAIVSAWSDSSGTRLRYGVIDSMGEYVIRPKFDRVHDGGFQAEGLLVAMEEPKPKHNLHLLHKRAKRYWGLINKKGNWVIKPTFTSIARNGFQDGLLYVEIDSLYGYVNPKGKFVWSAVRNEKPGTLDWYNIDFKRPAYYRGDDVPINSVPEDEPPQNLIQSGATSLGFQENQFGLYIDTVNPNIFERAYYGYKAYFFNTTKDTLSIKNVSYKFDIMAEAMDPSGKWWPIEESLQFGCGNEYFEALFYPNTFWAFDIPQYSGDFETSLRLVFSYDKIWNENDYTCKSLYSNTVTVKVNPAQFWRQESRFWEKELFRTYNF
jgi:WG containing repeat